MQKRKSHKSYCKSTNLNKSILKFGTYGLKTLSPICIESQDINNLSYYIDKQLKRLAVDSRKWNLINFNLNLTKLTSESRMGKGKGDIKDRATLLGAGSIILEFDNVKYLHVKKLYKLINKKFKSTKILLISRKKY
uniref:Ribosomal protein L16 n=1 Tax=Neogoniolithon spectabile TaxID=231755 RepID=A0A3G3MIQ0_9FLOR|nr:ribosomal protein L16 [Neogoniolithon spectabile]AYR06658.1 ribosomal protein L16 [Neogoniolithon spectabile]